MVASTQEFDDDRDGRGSGDRGPDGHRIFDELGTGRKIVAELDAAGPATVQRWLRMPVATAERAAEVPCRGKKKAIVAVGRSVLVIVWHLLSDPEARFHDLGSDFYDSRNSPDRRKRNHVRQLEALGHKVTLEPAA